MLIQKRDLPKRIRIMGIEYEVRISDYSKEPGNTSGTINQISSVINVINTVSPDLAREVLIHECIESMNYRMGWELEHTLLSEVSVGVLQVLRDNPEFVKFISSEKVKVKKDRTLEPK